MGGRQVPHSFPERLQRMQARGLQSIVGLAFRDRLRNRQRSPAVDSACRLRILSTPWGILTALANRPPCAYDAPLISSRVHILLCVRGAWVAWWCMCGWQEVIAR